MEGRIELRNVKFAYPARSDVMIFNGFDLVVPAGKTVALVGSSGSGKSTVSNPVLLHACATAAVAAVDAVTLQGGRCHTMQCPPGARDAGGGPR